MLTCVALLISALVLADEPAAVRLAPGPADLARVTEALEGELARAVAVDTALTRVHNRLAVQLSASSGRVDCDASELGTLLARTVPLGEAFRISAQRARNALAESEAYAAAPTLAPLLDATQTRSMEALRTSVEREQRRYLEARAWQERYLGPLLKRCPAGLAAAPGLELVTVPVLGDPPAPPVAVLGTGGGRVCPADVPADGQVVVLDAGQGCYGATACDCSPEPVLPAAVLGP